VALEVSSRLLRFRRLGLPAQALGLPAQALGLPAQAIACCGEGFSIRTSNVQRESATL
jgi:hypothetical protein